MTHFCLDDSPRFRMIELESTDSTNSFLAQYSPPYPTDVTLVTTEYQTAGRGQRGNTWESAAGRNLLFSLLIRPTQLPANRVFVVSEAIALSIREAAEALWEEAGTAGAGRPSFSVKWPNDIYADDRKLAGILIENDLTGLHIGRCIIGCGVNVNQEEWTMDSGQWTMDSGQWRVDNGQWTMDNGQWTMDNGQWAHKPVSLHQLVGHEVERRFVLEQIMAGFTRRYARIQAGQYDTIHRDYCAALFRRTGLHDYRDLTTGGTPFRATIADVETDGHLLLRDTEGRLRRFVFKEVAYA